jgi:hypothetical protein
MIRHQQFKKGFAGCQDLGGISFHFHSGFDGTNAGGAKNARSRVDQAETANADGRFILEMAQRGYRDSVYSRGVENACSGRDGHGSTIDGDVDKSER